MANLFLDGSMIERQVTRTIDQRDELRHPPVSATAVLEYRGRKHVVRMGDVSPSGAMVHFPHTPNIGETVLLHVLDRGRVSAQVRWVKQGRVGLSFTESAGDRRWR